MSKSTLLRRINQRLANQTTAPVELSATPAEQYTPVARTPGEVTALTVTPLVVALGADASILVTWDEPLAGRADRYTVQVSISDGFANVTGVTTTALSTELTGLRPGTLYYVRVASAIGVYQTWSDPITVTTLTDLNPPSDLDSVTASWSGSDLVLTPVWPAAGPSVNCERVVYAIYGAHGGPLYRTLVGAPKAAVRYPATLNLADTPGTGDPSLYVEARPYSYTDIAASSVASVSSTKPAPSAPAAVSLGGTIDSVIILISPPAQEADILRYRVVVTVNGVAQPALSATRAPVVFNLSSFSAPGGSVAVSASVVAVDHFGQLSLATATGTQSIDILSLANLRAAAIYSDSLGTGAATLKAALADGVTASGGIAYAAAPAWRWIECERPSEVQVQRITVAATAGIGYIGVSADGVAYSWYAGPAVGGVLTAAPSEAAAQSEAVSLAAQTRLKLPSPVRARFIRLGFRNTTTSTTVAEFYPRALVRSDDIEAETLSAIVANLGNVTAGSISGVDFNNGAGTFHVDAAGNLTATSADISGTIRFGGGNGLLSTSGLAIAAPTAGGFSYDPQRAVVWKTGEAVVAAVQAFTNVPIGGATNGVELHTFTSGLQNSMLNLVAEGSGTTSALYLRGTTSGMGDIHTQGYFGVNKTPAWPLDVNGEAVVSGNIYWGAGGNWLSAYINQAVTSASSPTFGAVYTSNWFRSVGSSGWFSESFGGGIYMDDATVVKVFGAKGIAALGNSAFGLLSMPASARLAVRGADTSAANIALLVQNGTPANLIYARNDGYLWANRAWDTSSDRRLKENIRPAAYGLAEVLRLSPALYDRLDGRKNELGFIAQEVEAVLPELVSVAQAEGDAEPTLALNYTGIIPVLVNAIKELQQEIAALKGSR